uniref:Uncharacterized protein n=1 Tax=Caulobacter sp. (strain K31) TaxID=366602 RepID=B0SXQ1_CAUSK
MPSTTDFQEFLDSEAPDGAQERADLAACASGPDDIGRYSSVIAPNGALIVSGGGETTLALTSPKAKAAFLAILEGEVSEPGATLEGDAEFERSMQKDD